MANYAYINVSQLAEEQAFIVRDVDAVSIITSSTITGLSGGAVFGAVGGIVGGAVGLIVGSLVAIFGDKKKGAMNTYRNLIAEVMGQVDPEAVDYRGEHDSVRLTKPAYPNVMLDIVRQMLIATRNTFDFGSDDYNDATEAINSLHITYNTKPCCNRTIIQFEVLEGNGIESILRNPNGILLLIGGYLLVSGE